MNWARIFTPWTPTHVLSVEGGVWRPWYHGRVGPNELAIAFTTWGRTNISTAVKGCRVHALLYPDGSVWDCVNGFRKQQP